MTNPAPEPDGRQRLFTFGRDVLVNVVANLVAAAFIYLAAVVGGYIDANPRIISTAASILALAALTTISYGVTTYIRLKGDAYGRRRLRRTFNIALGLVVVAAVMPT